MNIPLSPCVPENLVSRDGFSRPVPRQPAHLHTQAKSGAYLRDSSRVPRRRPFMKPPYAIGSVPSSRLRERERDSLVSQNLGRLVPRQSAHFPHSGRISYEILTRGIPPAFCKGRPFIIFYTVNRHRVSPEFISRHVIIAYR